MIAPTSPQNDENGGEVSIADEAARFRAVLLGDSRSTTLANLFDYLLERVDDPRAPKEIEVAMAVFGKSGAFDTSQNSMVRSHMHRLRQRLERYNAGKAGPSLTVPKGEYRLVLVDPHEEVEAAEELAALSAPSSSRLWMRRFLTIATAASALLWIAAFLWPDDRFQSSPLAKTVLWKPMISGGRAPVIAVGDIYLFGTSGNEGMLELLSRKSELQSEADLNRYLMMHPEHKGRLHDRGIYRVPSVQANATLEILKLVSPMSKAPADVVPMSRISQDRVDSNNIVFIQYFSQLPALRSPILHMSGFAPTADFNLIRDKVTGTVYEARNSIDDAAPQRGGSAQTPSYGTDYGYIASFPGTSGRHNLLISGIGDAALSQMVKVVRDKQLLDTLARQTGNISNFEALYRVRTVGGLVFETKLLVARPLTSN
ncbi:hypothetical protein GGQ88_000544 [Novosphingobium hassiacum]|uniref:OmpR/PhoB-type domain-containing protein n=1 Tax=Novosphingobium hassiacum TaxID=173676 RepID=A0A7W5ZVP3_9SPHN|nr:hypothetical protein [Novosphingobium hassiacum]MBB3859304.1 hypothetical protein [Novosphingobium hassiacum]